MPFDVADEFAFEQLNASERQQWFSDNLAQDMERWLGQNKSGKSERPPGTRDELDPELLQGFEKMLELEQLALGEIRSTRLVLNAHPDTDWAAAFSRLSTETQLGIFRGWTRQHAPAEVATDVDFVSGKEILITLPDGSQMAENWDRDNPNYDPSDYTLPEDRGMKSKAGGRRLILRFGMGGILSLLVAGGLYLALSGDDSPSSLSSSDATADTADTDTASPTSGTDEEIGAAGPEESIPSGAADWSTADPLGDFEKWDIFDVIDRTRERGGVNAGEFQDAADLSGLSVSASGDTTLVTVSHGGDAQSAQAESEGDFSESVVVVLSDGTRWEVIFHDDGSVKIVSAPPGVSVTKEWITPQQVLFTLSGITVDAGSTIEATLFLGIFGGAMIDVVNLIATG